MRRRVRRPDRDEPARVGPFHPLQHFYDRFAIYIEDRRVSRGRTCAGLRRRRSRTARSLRSSMSCGAATCSRPSGDDRPVAQLALMVLAEQPELQQLLRASATAPELHRGALRIEIPIKGELSASRCRSRRRVARCRRLDLHASERAANRDPRTSTTRPPSTSRVPRSPPHFAFGRGVHNRPARRSPAPKLARR